jgi:hypothetical protein
MTAPLEERGSSDLRLALNTRGKERGDPPGIGGKPIGGFNYNGPKIAKLKCHK